MFVITRSLCYPNVWLTCKTESFYNNYELRTSLTIKKKPLKLPRRWKVPKIIETQNLASIGFQKLDRLLMRRLYELSFPVIRKRLWISSKSTSKLGKKPVTYVAERIKIHKRLHLIPEYQNAVFFCDLSFRFQDLDSATLQRIPQFIECQHLEVEFKRCQIDAAKHHILLHPGLYRVYYTYCNISLETALKITPQVINLGFYDKLPENWEMVLSKWDNPNLKICYMAPENIGNFALLSTWMRQRDSSFTLFIHNKNTERNEDELLKSFTPDERWFGRCLYFGWIVDGKIYRLKWNFPCTIL